MNNKKTLWFGLVAALAITPILVANLAFSSGPPPSLPPVKAGEASGPALYLGAPITETPKRLEDLTLPAGPAPFLPPPVSSPRAKMNLTGGGEPKKDDPKTPDVPKTPDTTPPTTDPTTQQPATGTSGYGFVNKLGATPTNTQGTGGTPAVVGGNEPVAPGGVSDLLSKSNAASGVEIQRRSPLVGDPRIEGLHFGQITTQADGAFWFPARVDLDTVISKLNSGNVDNITIVKGPFSVRYGPGFSFLDVESIGTPRNKDGFDVHGSTSVSYRTNGEGFQGQQSFYGGGSDWGFRISYDLQSAGDYTTGNGTKLPSSYNNQFVNFAFGMDLSDCSSIEVKYLHVQQNGVLFPGLLTDINNLTTDAFTFRYKAVKGSWYDQLTLDAWVNSTKFNGDSSNPQTRKQIPQLDDIFPANLTRDNAALNAAFGPVRLDITTNGYALSYGAREITTWGDPKGFNFSLGADIRVFSSYYNEFDAFNFSVLPGTGMPGNFGIPNARQIDPGILSDASIPIGENFVAKAGTRVDFVTSQFLGFGPNTDIATYNATVGNPQGDKAVFLFAGFLSGEYKLSKEWTAQAGYGYAQRAPTLTELYSGGAFLGMVQNGFNSIYGNPNLLKEEMHQINVGIKGEYEDLRVGGNAYYGWVQNYITFQSQGPFTVGNIAVPQPFSQGTPIFFTGTTPINQLRFINTNLATLYGFDAYAEYDALRWLTPFATLNFVEGWDQSRSEALPGIAPLSSRVGFRIHEPEKNPKWGVEYYARLVATQDLFAASLGEARTGGFVVHNMRAYWQVKDNCQLLAGVENIGNLQYREHLDLRTGFGVFQPGINFYFGMKVSY